MMNNANQFDNYRNGMDVGNMPPLFHKKTERINWKILATVDIDKIIQQNDIRALRDNIKHVAFCDIESELDLRDCDRNLVKIFKLTQLMVDYLLSSQECLAGAVNSAEERSQLMIEEADAAKRKLQENEGFISELKRECHRRKKLILAQQQIMDSGPNAYHRCPYCEKAFLNSSFLQAHLEKRHADRYIKDWHLTDSPRKRSPKRERSEEHISQKDRNLELLLQKLLEQRMSSPISHRHNDDDVRRMADEFDRERNDWQNAMRQLQNEIEELHSRLGRANSKNKKHRSHLKELEDDMASLTKEDVEKARQKAIVAHKKKPIVISENIATDNRIKKPKKRSEEERVDTFGSSQTNQTNLNEAPYSRTSQRQPDKYNVESHKPVSPRRTISSPVHRNNNDRERPVRESMNRSSNQLSDNFDYLGFDFSKDLIDKFCDEVRHMLDDHLELHGIKRGTVGISGAVLQDKLKLMNHEQSQLKAKYLNYAENRKKLEAEVEQEARSRLKNALEKPQVRDSRNPERAKPQLSARSLQSSQSEWDDESQQKQTLKAGSPVRVPMKSLPNEKEEYNKTIEQKVRNRSPEGSPDRKSNLHLSSDMSNTIGSSAWKTESKAVTSVAHPSNIHKPTATNRSSDYEDESDFSI